MLREARCYGKTHQSKSSRQERSLWSNIGPFLTISSYMVHSSFQMPHCRLANRTTRLQIRLPIIGYWTGRMEERKAKQQLAIARQFNSAKQMQPQAHGHSGVTVTLCRATSSQALTAQMAPTYASQNLNKYQKANYPKYPVSMLNRRHITSNSSRPQAGWDLRKLTLAPAP